MYRWILIFALLSFADSVDLVSRASCRGDVSRYCRPSKARHYGPPHNYYHGNGQTETGTLDQPTVQPLPPANTFEDLAQNLAAAESAVRKYCGDNSNETVKENFDLENYVLEYTLHDLKDNNVSVKIKHEVIYVTANQVGLKSFKDLRILPSIVNTRQASWELRKNILTIVIPYNVAFRREVFNECRDVNDTITEVPSMESNIKTQKDVQQSTSIAQPKIPSNKETDKVRVNDLSAIFFPDN